MEDHVYDIFLYSKEWSIFLDFRKVKIYTRQPYNSSNFDNSDGNRISNQNQDLHLLPAQSIIHIYGKIKTTDNSEGKNTTLVGD